MAALECMALLTAWRTKNGAALNMLAEELDALTLAEILDVATKAIDLLADAIGWDRDELFQRLAADVALQGDSE